MERLQRILTEVDRPTPGQSQAPRARKFSAIGHDQAEGGPLQRSHVHARPAHVIKLKPRADLQIARCSAMYFRQQSGCGSLVRVAPEQGVSSSGLYEPFCLWARLILGLSVGPRSLVGAEGRRGHLPQ
jgi:hypothetical protein